MSEAVFVILVFGAFFCGFCMGAVVVFILGHRTAKAEVDRSQTTAPVDSFSEEEIEEMKKAREQLKADNEAFGILMSYGVQQAYGYPAKDR